jgi:hypothetical protein
MSYKWTWEPTFMSYKWTTAGPLSLIRWTSAAYRPYTFTYTTWTSAPMFTYTTWTSAAYRPHTKVGGRPAYRPHTNTYTDIHTQKQTRVGGNQPDKCKDLFRLETVDNSIGKVFLDVPEMLDCTGSYDITVQVSLWLIESWLKVLLN